MGKFIDLTGQKFGKLTVVSRNVDKISPCGQKYTTWDCVCDCGNKTIVSSNNLRRGHTNSCGCLNINRERFNNLVGMRFENLEVLHRAEDYVKPSGRKILMWQCRCDCGNIVTVSGDSLKYGNTKSCSCKRRNNFRTHGKSNTRLYEIWTDMKQRCLNPNQKTYKYYGGRGITICKEWLDDFMNFYNWAMGNGYQDKLTIDRIDVNGKYEPNNCRWVTMETQLRNTRRNHFIEINGESHTIAEWARIYKINPQTINSRIRKGVSEQNAILLPVKRKRGKKMKIYISGQISNLEKSDYMERFAKAEKELTEQGYSVVNPAKVNAQLPEDTSYEEYMNMCFCMLDMCITIYMLQGWEKSCGANREYGYAMAKDKTIIFE